MLLIRFVPAESLASTCPNVDARLKNSFATPVFGKKDLVFPSKTGTPMDWDNLIARNYKPLRKAADLPETTRFYDLRHPFATLMLEQGENPKVVQEILGHSQITNTMDTYFHAQYAARGLYPAGPTSEIALVYIATTRHGEQGGLAQAGRKNSARPASGT